MNVIMLFVVILHLVVLLDVVLIVIILSTDRVLQAECHYAAC